VLAFEQNTLVLLKHNTVIGEFAQYEQHLTPSGALSFGAPELAHDDIVMSVALAWHGVVTGGGFWASHE
jgi:hypothetical protein